MRKKGILALENTTALTNDFLAEIGRIVANFAILEAELEKVVHKLLGLDRKLKQVITSELSFNVLRHLSFSLIKESFGEEKGKEYREVLKQISKAEDIRNRYLHSLYGYGGTKDGESIVIQTKYTAKTKKGLDFSRIELTVSSLNEKAFQIATITGVLKDFVSLHITDF